MAKHPSLLASATTTLMQWLFSMSRTGGPAADLVCWWAFYSHFQSSRILGVPPCEHKQFWCKKIPFQRQLVWVGLVSSPLIHIQKVATSFFPEYRKIEQILLEKWIYEFACSRTFAMVHSLSIKVGGLSKIRRRHLNWNASNIIWIGRG